jgi:nicotinate-nucleotide pyrophosphorylase (carboxylating)
MRVSGDARTLLAAERTILNLLSRMSGIATTTRNLIEKTEKAKLKVRITCTRKTAPGLLYFDKKAVSVGGADTHRLHLDDMILIKDNHIVIAGSVENALRKVKEKVSFSKKIEVEVTCSDDALKAAKERADIIMLDNFSPSHIEKTIKLLKKNDLLKEILLEASGGITSENILAFASSGVDILSLSEITNSSRALDMSLEIIQVN